MVKTHQGGIGIKICIYPIKCRKQKKKKKKTHLWEEIMNSTNRVGALNKPFNILENMMERSTLS